MEHLSEDEVFWEEDGYKIVNEDIALSYMLKEGVFLLNSVKDNCGDYTTGLWVICSDTFAWGCADCEPILSNDGEEPSEIIDLYRLWKENKKWGATQWVCYKRKEQPQKPVKAMMIKDGAWHEYLERLPENNYDKKVRENIPNINMKFQDKIDMMPDIELLDELLFWYHRYENPNNADLILNEEIELMRKEISRRMAGRDYQ